jgi:predicted nuclease of predicted toxin-antitoxin system
MKPAILLDEDTHLALAEALRQRGFDAVHIQEIGRKSYSDADQLDFAVQNERCIVSFNRKDFVALHKEYILTNRHHFGIIVTSHLPISQALQRIGTFLSRTTANELSDELRHL